MNLRRARDYSIGLDLGTGSVGWAVTDAEGNLYSFKGRPAMGSRTFPNAEPASVARIPRGQRRRYERRRQRIELLQQFFMSDMERVDPDFFTRLNQSSLLAEDKDESIASCAWPIFNSSDFTEKDYHKQFPTIYHLRAFLCESDEKADLRLVYLALHNIVKHRGNFLYQDNPALSASDASVDEAVRQLVDALAEWCQNKDIELSCDAKRIIEVFGDASLRRAGKRDQLKGLLGLPADLAKAMGKELASAVLGYTANFSKIFLLSDAEHKFSLGNDEKVEEFETICPNECTSLFFALRTAYSAYFLSGILRDANGKTLSFCKKKEYERYHDDLALLKALVREYAPESYQSFFGGERLVVNGRMTKRYDPTKAKGYTKYDLVHSAGSYDELAKDVKKLLGSLAADDPRYQQMMQAFDEERFLRRLKTSDNGSIPYQLHLEELRAIITRQGEFYPFLKEESKKIESLVSFRIPYYVGPLTTKNAAVDAHGNKRFAWSERKPGMESAKVRPWNWDDVIDRGKSAENFIVRMTGTCTYLQDEKVLPRCSLLYEEFCVLNELNGAHWSADGDHECPFDTSDRRGIVQDLFCGKRRVSYKQVEDWLRQHGNRRARVSGGQGESGFESKMSSYIFFSKDVLHVGRIDPADFPMIEEIILWNTLFEDRDILKERIEEAYGDRLNAEQIKTICKKRFTGWGRLSRRLLTGIKAQTDQGDLSIMDILREGDPNNDHRGKAMVFMGILHSEDLGFQKKIDQINQEKVSAGKVSLEDLPGSPALRRSINQAMRVVDEIVSIAKCPPSHIYLEVTRDEDGARKGRRSTRRYDAIKAALEKFKEESPTWFDQDVFGEFRRSRAEDLDERLSLYFMQGGKSLYSATPLKLELLHTNQYQVDHIIPQSYIKDDSFENKALVLAGENQRKSDALLIDSSIRTAMAPYWRALHQAGLMGDKKFNSLMCSSISDKRVRGFIARQLVETSQIVKLAGMMLQSNYPEADVQPVKASLGHDLRVQAGFIKCREVNDFHHAHDALIACEVGRYINQCHPGIYDNPIGYARAVRELVRKQNEEMRKYGRLPGSAGFIVGGFMRTHVDVDTGEVVWDAEEELSRIRAYLDYSNVFVTRMPEETSGALWNATIYSPHYGKTAPTLHIKQGLDVQRYGGYSSATFAYFTLYVAEKGKKRKAELLGIPISVARKIEGEPSKLDAFVAQDAEAKKLKHPLIIRARILKYARFEMEGNQFYFAAQDAVYSARQLVLKGDLYSVAAKACDKHLNDSCISNEDLIRLYDELVHKGDLLCNKFGNVTDVLRAGRERYAGLSISEKRQLVCNVLAYYRSATARVDISLVGGPKHAGNLGIAFVLNNPEAIVFVDQSVTGMFEKRTRVEL